MRKQSLLILTSVAISFLFVAIFSYAGTTISTSITTTGDLTVGGATALNGGLTMDTNKFTVADVSGNTAIAGTVAVTGSYMTFGTTTKQGLSVLTIEATSTAAVPLTLIGYDGQTGNLFQIKNAVGTNLLALDYSGRMTTNVNINGKATTTAASGNFATQGAVSASSTLLVTGAVTAYSTLTVSGSGATDLGGTLTVTGNSVFTTASSTATTTLNTLRIGPASTAAPATNASTTISGLIFGTCTVTPQGVSIAAGEATTTNCTANGVWVGDKVFMTPTNLESYVIFNSASSTGSNTIQVAVSNSSTSTILGITAHTWYWMAVR